MESVRALLALGPPPAVPEPPVQESFGAVTNSLPPVLPPAPPPAVLSPPSEPPALHGSPLVEQAPPAHITDAPWSPSGGRLFWLVALTGLLSGLLSSGADVLWGKPFDNRYFPGLGFGLALGGWLLWARWLKASWLPVLLLASTLAYTAAHYTAECVFKGFYVGNAPFALFPSGLMNVVARFPDAYFSLLLAMAGFVGGAVGTSLLVGALALFCAPFRRWTSAVSLLLVGSSAGMGLCVLSIFPKVIPVAHGTSWAYCLFVAAWQLAVAANVGVGLSRGLQGVPLAGSASSLRPWIRRLVWVEAVVLIGIVAFWARCLVENRREEVTSALRAQQNEARGLLDEASKASRPDEWMAVIERTTTLIAQAPQLAAAYLSRAAVYQKLKQPARAIQDYDAAIEREANSALAYNLRGTAYDDLDQPGRAIEDYSRAIELDPKFAPAYYNRCVACQKLGQHAPAVRDGTRAIELEPNSAFVYLARGLAHDALGHRQLAIDDYTRAIEVEPKLASAYLARAKVYQALGNQEAARRDSARARELQKAAPP